MRRYILKWWRDRAYNKVIDQERPITEHLEELRTRLLYSVLGIVLCAIIGFVYAREIIGFLMGPLRQAIVGLDVPPQLHFTSITEPLFQSFRIAIFAGLFLAFPFWVYQLWLFVAPGLYPQEKKMVGPVIVSATFLFLVGATFAYTVAVPLAYRFLLIYANPHQEKAAAAPPQRRGPMFALRETGNSQASHRTVPTQRQQPTLRQAPATSQPIRRKLAPPRLHAPAPVKPSSGALITIQEPDPKQPSQGLNIQLTLRPPKSDMNKPILSPEQWLTLLLQQKQLHITWRKGQAERNFQLQLNWPEAPKASSSMGELKPILTLQAYLALSSWFLFGFGLIFQTPLVIFLVIIAGIITPEELGQYRRHAFVAILAISAILTPTGDPLNLMIMAIPMYILFELGLWVSRIYLRSQPATLDDQS